MAEQSLKEKTVNGTFWSAADAFLGQGVTLIVGILLARMLSPAEYGLIGICLIFNTVLNGVVDSGFSNALIRKKEVSNLEYNTMFLTNLTTSCVLYILLFLSAPFISVFFNHIELASLIRVTGVVLFFNALSLTHSTILTKRVDFRTKTKASVTSAFCSGVIGIGMAYSGFGVWSLVGQLLSKQLTYTLALWILISWWPNLNFSLSAFRYMWGFGWKLLVSGLLTNTWDQLYQIVIGKCYSPATLGQYTKSIEYAGLFSANITGVIQRVSYPVLSEIQDEKERLIGAYRQIIKNTMFITCTCMFSLGALSETLIYCLIGPQWSEAATYLPLICISMSFYPLHAINLNMLQVQGRSDVYLYLEIIKKPVGLIPICLGVFFNIYIMLISSIFTGIICFFLNSWYTGKKLDYTSWMQIKDIAADYGISLLVAFSIYILKFLPFSYWVILPIQIVTGLFILLIVCEIIKLPEYIETKSIVLNLFKKIVNHA